MAAKKKPAKRAKAAKAQPAKPRGTAREEVLGMLRTGASLDALMKHLDWQAHSVRGLISNLGRAGTKSKAKRRRAGLPAGKMMLLLVYFAGGLGSWAFTAWLLKRSRRDDSDSVRYLLANAPA